MGEPTGRLVSRRLCCLRLVCLWSGYRQLDVRGAVCSFGWGESSEKHQWAEAWHGHASTHTYTVNTGLAEKRGWWRTGWGKNFPAEENKPKTRSVNKNHTSQRCGPLEFLTLSVEESPKVSEKPRFPLGPDRWSPVELASWKRSLKAEVNNRGVRVKCLQSTTVGKWGDDAWGVREQKEEMDVRKGKTERVLERAAVMGDDSEVRSDQIPEQSSSASIS